MIKKVNFILLLSSLTLCTFTDAYFIRHATKADIPALVTFYKTAAVQKNNLLVKTPDEITPEYVTSIVTNKTNDGFCLVAKDDNKQLYGVIHTQRLEQTQSQTLGETTLLINPELLGKGLDQQLLASSIHVIKESYHDILRFEAVVRESDQQSINLYSSVGFKQEGRLEKRIVNNNGDLEASVVMVWFRPKTVLRSKI